MKSDQRTVKNRVESGERRVESGECAVESNGLKWRVESDE